MAIATTLGAPTFIPTPQDATLQIDSAQVITATGQGTTFDFDQIGGGVTNIGQIGGAVSAGDLASSGATDTTAAPGSGWNPGGLGKPLAIVIQASAIVTAGSATYTAQWIESADGTNWVPAGIPVAVTANGVWVIKGFSTLRYTAILWTVTGSGSPSITYNAWANPNIGV